MSQRRGIDHLEGQPLASESVMLACASADASSALFLRLCRYPTAGTNWLWARVITPTTNLGYSDNYLPCSSTALNLEESPIEYATEDGMMAALWRERDRARPSRCGARATMMMTGDGDPSGATTSVSIGAEFTPLRGHSGLLTERTEIFGRTNVQVTAGVERFRFAGFGQFHEQPQLAARFVTPFTYMSLWSERFSCVALFTAGASGGYLFREGKMIRATSFAASHPAKERRLTMKLEDGTEFASIAQLKHSYRVPVYGNHWRGSFVIVDTPAGPVPGMLNGWCEETLPPGQIVRPLRR